jgi:three-Cys-motif partner protein
VVAHDEFFQRQQAAAVLKHGILKRYPGVFATMAGSRSGRVLYFDGYAGPGRYADGAPGSPLIALETARRTAAWARQVDCIFVEKKRAYADDLRAVLGAEAPAEFTYDVWHGDVADHVDAALARAGDDPMLTLLDPFGTALDYASLTDKLLGRRADQATEVMLNLSLTSVWRIGGLLTGDETEAEADGTLARLDAFFGDTWWREEFRAARATGDLASAADAALLVAREFTRRVHAATGFDSADVEVRRRPGQRPLFLFVLFYRYPFAPWKFNEAVSKANGEWRHACRREDLDGFLAEVATGPEDLFGGQMTTELAAEATEAAWRKQEQQLDAEWTAAIADNLRQLMASASAIRLGDHLREVYGPTLGLARDQHVNAAWRILEKAGEAAPKEKNVKHLERAWLRRPDST